MRTRVRWAAAATVLLLGGGAVLAGCGGGGGGSAAGGTTTPAAGFTSGADRAASDAVKEPGATGLNRPVVETKAKIRTGQVVLVGRHLDRARQEVDRELRVLGGSVDDEQTTHRRDGSIARSVLTLRVPVTVFGRAMADLGRLARQRSADTQTVDVTQQVIDVHERLQTLQNSLDRLQRFQRQSADINDLLRFEQEITQREQEIQSLTAQRDYLADQTAMSTITLTLERPEAVPPGALHDAGFLAGLRAGWHTLVAAGIVLLTALGAVLPFAVLLALVGVPGWLLLRRVLRARRTDGSAPPTAPAEV
jgi:hypothetical protein